MMLFVQPVKKFIAPIDNRIDFAIKRVTDAAQRRNYVSKIYLSHHNHVHVAAMVFSARCK